MTQLAIVLSGGGARGAYEAGVLHYVRTMLPNKQRTRPIDILCGSSVGSINASFLAATAHDLEYQGKAIRELWLHVREKNIYRHNFKALIGFLSKSTAGIMGKFIKRADRGSPHFPGFLNTEPFLPFIEKIIPWKNISQNIESGLVQALSIVATNVFTGRVELFIEKNDACQYNGEHFTHLTKIQPIHAMASAAIPIIFPTVLVNEIAYTDGGLRLNTPLSPAIHLGAEAILVIGLNHRANPGEKIPSHGQRGKHAALGQVLGRVMNSVFLDKIQYDIEQLDRINKIIEWGENLYGKTFLPDLNRMLAKKGIRGDVADRGLKKLRVLRIRPSQDIGEIFRACFKQGQRQYYNTFEKLLVRFLDIDPNGGVDFLSYINFIPEYVKKLLDLGFEDARHHHEELKSLFEK